MNKLSIAGKLLLVSLISVTALISVGAYGIYNVKTTFLWVEQVYDKNKVVGQLFKEFMIPFNMLRRESIYVVIAPDDQSLEKANKNRVETIKKLDTLAEAWYKNKVTDEDEVQIFQKLLSTWQQYKVLSNYSAEQTQLGHYETAFINTMGAERGQFLVVENMLGTWIQYQGKRAESVYTQAQNYYQQIWWVAFLSISFTACLVFAINFFVAKRMIRPLLRVKEQLKSLSKGQFMQEKIVYRGQDEITEIIFSVEQVKEAIQGTIAQAITISSGDCTQEVKLLSDKDQLGLAWTSMVQTLRNVIQQANAIARGDYSQEIQVISDRDQLGQALVNMMTVLKDATVHNALQDWLKTGLAKLNDRLRGEQDIAILAKNTIDFITGYLNAQMGLFYRKRELATQPIPIFELVASYAYVHHSDQPRQFSLGEGLVGQAALEKKKLVCTHHPEEYLHITRSGLSQAIPRHVFIIPFLYETEVMGVIEIGSFETLTPIQQDFLEQTMPIIGISANSAQAREKMQLLLQQSQQQSKELEIQQEELQATNEELQTQTEELQTQQEELRQSNEELEQRTKELERQRNSINEKNRELEKAQQAIETKAKELEIASKYKSEFLANMSHELRTPLNSVLILAKLLADNKDGNLSGKQVEYASTIHSAGSDLLSLINEVLDLSKVEAGKIEIHKEEVILSELVASTQQKFQHLANDKGISFQVHLPDLLPALYTDGQRLKQIINNLLGNAFKFTSQGEVCLTFRKAEPHEFKSQEFKNTEFLAMSVTDTGVGIPKDKQQVIFEAFQQADGTTSRRYGGTGLGLTISRQLVRLLGGDILLHSEEGKGSCFTIYLPLLKPDQEIKRSSPPSSSPKTSEPKMSEVKSKPEVKPNSEESRTLPSLQYEEPIPRQSPIEDDRHNLLPHDKMIMIIEDDSKFLKILMELAHEKNFKCLVAQDGKSGLQLVSMYKPDAIILDVGLPMVDGWSVMEELKSNPETRHIPVHFISALEQSPDAKKMGAIGCLLKPVGMTELSNAFKKIEHFIAESIRYLLVVTDDETRQDRILDIVGSIEVDITCVANQTEAYRHLKQTPFDCLVLDIACEHDTSIRLLEKISQEENLSQIPVIVYAERELTEQEEALLHQYERNLTIKAVSSPERLLDEATLFLHQVEANLTKEKQKILRRVHDKEAILTGKKVLLVDDDVRNTFALMTFLDGKNMQVVVANHGKEALESLNEHPDVDIILMDIMMPEMDGYETMKHIREKPKFRKLPIIALTAKAMKGDKSKCIEAGANDYIAKPVDTDKLMSLMRVWLYR